MLIDLLLYTAIMVTYAWVGRFFATLEVIITGVHDAEIKLETYFFWPFIITFKILFVILDLINVAYKSVGKICQRFIK